MTVRHEDDATPRRSDPLRIAASWEHETRVRLRWEYGCSDERVDELLSAWEAVARELRLVRWQREYWDAALEWFAEPGRAS